MLKFIDRWLAGLIKPVLKTIAVEHGMVTPESCRTCREIQNKQLTQVNEARVEQVRILKEELDSVKATNERLVEETRKHNEVIKEYVDARYQQSKWYLNMTNKVDQVLNENSNLRDRIAELEKEIGQLRKEIETLREENSELKELLEERELELAACKAKLKGSEE